MRFYPGTTIEPLLHEQFANAVPGRYEQSVSSLSEQPILNAEPMLLDSGFEIVDKKVIGAELPDDDKVRPGEDFIYFRCTLQNRTTGAA